MPLKIYFPIAIEGKGGLIKWQCQSFFSKMCLTTWDIMDHQIKKAGSDSRIQVYLLPEQVFFLWHKTTKTTLPPSTKQKQM